MSKPLWTDELIMNTHAETNTETYPPSLPSPSSTPHSVPPFNSIPSPPMSISPLPSRSVPNSPLDSIAVIHHPSPPTHFTHRTSSVCTHLPSFPSINQSVNLFISLSSGSRESWSALREASYLALNRSPTCQHWFPNHTHSLIHCYHAWLDAVLCHICTIRLSSQRNIPCTLTVNDRLAAAWILCFSSVFVVFVFIVQCRVTLFISFHLILFYVLWLYFIEKKENKSHINILTLVC